MSYNRSIFPEGGIDPVVEMFDISPTDKPDIDEYFILCTLTNPTQIQTDRMAYLLTTYNNKILNAEKINYFLDIAINTEKFWFDTVNNYLKFITNYDILYLYNIYNTTIDVNGDLYMSLVSNNVGNPLSDSSKWRKISQRGLQGIQGLQGQTGIGLAFIGPYDPSATYTINQGVEYNGSLYGCISSVPITGISPGDIGNWSMVVSKGSSTFLTVLRNSVIVNTNISSIAIGIVGFNKNNDQIFVYKDSIYVEQNQEYLLNSDGLSIVKTVGTWDGTITPINFNFVVFKNVVQGVALSDGSLIQIQSITLDKLNLDIQNKISKIGVAVLQTTAQDLSGAVNENTNNLIAHKADTAYQVATGTATAITVTTATLTDGYAKTFIASANNAGVATTINAKPLYKPSTVIAPTLIAGKAYTVWYNLAGNCFFIKASAEGTATVAQVLAGVPFSNETDTGLIGTIPSKGVATIAPSTVNQTIAAGQYLSGIQTILGDADAVAANYKHNVNIHGTIGNYDTEATVPITAATVLTGKRGRVNGVTIVGTMVDRAGDTAAIASSVVGTTLKLRASTGYRDGVDDNVIITDTDFIAANIANGKNVFGLLGTLVPLTTEKAYATGAAAVVNTTEQTITVTGLSFIPRIIAIHGITDYDAYFNFASVEGSNNTSMVFDDPSPSSVYCNSGMGTCSKSAGGFVYKAGDYSRGKIVGSVTWWAFS